MMNTIELFRNVCFMVFVAMSTITFIVLIKKIKLKKEK